MLHIDSQSIHIPQEERKRLASHHHCPLHDLQALDMRIIILSQLWFGKHDMCTCVCVTCGGSLPDIKYQSDIL